MKRLKGFEKLLLILTCLLVLAGSVNVANAIPANQEEQQQNANQPEESETYVQSFDVVSQNIQIQFDHFRLDNNPLVEAEERSSILIASGFQLASTKFYKILFEQIISTNAP